MAKLRLHIVLLILIAFSCLFVSCEGSSPAITMKVKDCDSIVVTEIDGGETLMVITDAKLKKQLFHILTSQTSRRFIKSPMNLNLYFIGPKEQESMGVGNNCVSSIKGGFKCPMNLEKKLREIANEKDSI
jgi:hypothetical protein